MNENKSPSVCDYTGSDYQSEFWDAGTRRYEDACEGVALKRLLPSAGRLLLELGAGAGRNSPRYAGWERVVLLDYARSQLVQARERLGDDPRYLYVAGDIYHLPFIPALFDGATMIRTLHHMQDPLLALQEVARVLGSDATFILEFANKRNLKAILRYLMRQQSWNPFSPEQVEFVELNFNFHPKTVRALLKEAGFSLHKQLNVSSFRSDWFKRHVPHESLVRMDALLQGTACIIQLSPSVFSLTSRNATAEPIARAGENVAFFACPNCHTPLPLHPESLNCPSCSAIWDYSDGIYDFRPKA